jgi:adenine-specific DNA-methyltransferase
MVKRAVNPVERQSVDLVKENIARLKELFPEVVSEGEVDFAKLKATLGEIADDKSERYSFTWAGKRDAIRLLQVPSRATLKPCPEESVNWEKTKNVLIEGENLEVLKLLYKSYAGRVKMIYIDPPYNKGKDYIYRDNFADPLDTYLQLTGQKDAEGNLLTSNPEGSGRFHSVWLSMIYPRLFVARQLLREDGFIVVSVDDNEMPRLRSILDEVFGEENFVAALVWDRNRKNDAKLFSVGHEYMLVYGRNVCCLKEQHVVLRVTKEGVEDVRVEFERLRKEHDDDWPEIRKGLRQWFAELNEDDPRKPLARFNKVDAQGPYRDDGDISWPGSGGPRYDVLHPITGRSCKVPSRGWVYPTKQRMETEILKGLVVFGADEHTIPSLRRNLFEKTEQVMRSVQFSYAQTASQEFDKVFDDRRVFDNPKHYSDLQQIVEYLTEGDDLVLDFFAGTCSVAHAVMAANRKEPLGRRYICVQLPEPVNVKTVSGKNAWEMGFRTIADIAKERLRRVIDRLKAETQNTLEFVKPIYAEDLGFRVFKLAESSYRQWHGLEEKDGQKYTDEMALFTDPLLAGWQPEGVIWEVALKEGYSLSSTVEALSEAKGNRVFRVTDPDREQSFCICLDDKLDNETVKSLTLGKTDLFVCRDAALTDEQAANLALQCKLKTI